MSDLVVVAFDRLDDALEAMKHIRQLERENKVELEDTAVVRIRPDGKAEVKNELTGTTETGAAIGAIIGALITPFFPVVGLVLGAAAGAAIGSLMATGVEQDFIDDVKRQLTPGRSALFLVVRQADMDAFVAALRPFKGEVIQTTLPTDAEEALKEALAV